MKARVEAFRSPSRHRLPLLAELLGAALTYNLTSLLSDSVPGWLVPRLREAITRTAAPAIRKVRLMLRGGWVMCMQPRRTSAFRVSAGLGPSARCSAQGARHAHLGRSEGGMAASADHD